MRIARHIFLLFAVASCGGTSANRSEVAQLRADVAAMETRLQQAEARQLALPASDDSPLVASGPSPDMNRELTVVELFAGIVERVCACEDMKCAEHEIRALEALDSEDKPGPEEMKAIMTDMEKLSNCMIKLSEADTAAGTP